MVWAPSKLDVGKEIASFHVMVEKGGLALEVLESSKIDSLNTRPLLVSVELGRELASNNKELASNNVTLTSQS